LPPLTDPRREAFARAVARGRTKAAAYVEAGYVANRSGGTRLTAMPGVAARIAELVAQREAADEASLATTILQLLALAKAANTATAAGAKEARLARLEANRLWETLERREEAESRPVERELTQAEWTAQFGYLNGG